jgi:hypothetical protein
MKEEKQRNELADEQMNGNTYQRCQNNSAYQMYLKRGVRVYIVIPACEINISGQ